MDSSTTQASVTPPRGSAPVEAGRRRNLLTRWRSELIRRALYPALQRRFSPSAFRLLHEYRRHEFSSPEDIRKIQWERLQNLLRHAAQMVPYYRNLFRSEGIDIAAIRSAEDFSRIPILNKAIMRAHSAGLLAEDVEPSERFLNASGGSTGKPLQFYQDRKYWDWARASQWFVEGWWGIRPGDPTASLWGADRDLPQLHWKERLVAAICQMRVCNVFAVTQDQLNAFAEMLSSWQPPFVIGYASALALFARILLERPHLRIRPRAVKSTAEALHEEERALIEKAFGAPVCNFYGSREVNNLAAECPARAGLHVNSLGRYVEVVDGAGKPAAPGVLGRVVVTDMTNYAMPFIRYEIEDLGSWSAALCSCGRPFPLLASIAGRKSDFIVTPAGKLIHGEFFTHLFYDLPQVSHFQVVQDSLHDVRVQVVLPPEGSAATLDQLRERMVQALGPDVRCEVYAVNRIDRPPSGKHRFTVSSVSVPWGAAVQEELKVGGEGPR